MHGSEACAFAGVDQFNDKVLAHQATEVWRDPKKVQRYYELAFQGTGSAATDNELPKLVGLNHEKTLEYQKWTPFADVWDVRCCFLPLLGSLAWASCSRRPTPQLAMGQQTRHHKRLLRAISSVTLIQACACRASFLTCGCRI